MKELVEARDKLIEARNKLNDKAPVEAERLKSAITQIDIVMQSLKTQKFYTLFCVMLLIAWGTTVYAQEPLPHIPGTEMYWGMPYQEAQQMFPGDHRGFILVRQQQFAGMPETHPVTGQYFFNPQQQLGYAQFTPAYQHQQHPEYWQGEYEHITGYMTDIYGNPVAIRDNRTIWQSPQTQGQLIQNSIQLEGAEIQTGWIFRFDPIPQHEGE